MEDRFPIVVPICPWCQEPGFHKDSAACLVELLDAIALLQLTPAVAEAVRTFRARDRSPQFLRRDRCDLPPTDVTPKIPTP